MTWTTVLMLGLTAFFCVSMTSAAPFEQAFKITKINGECVVMVPDAKSFVAAIEGQAYPYGSKIKTGRKSSVVVEFSSGNFCRVLASTILAVNEQAKDKKAKTIKLDDGQISVELEEKFHENNSMTVETAAAICGAIGCKFNVKSYIENDFKIMWIECIEGKLRITGPDFEIPLLEKDDSVSIAKADEKSFLRIKNVKGTFNINLKNSQGEPISPELKLGYSVKIYREVSPNGQNMLVYDLIINAEGKTEMTSAYSRPIDPLIDTEAKITDTEKKKDEKVVPEGEIEPITVTPTTTTTTTTTTLSPADALRLRNLTPSVSPTPVGKR